MRYLKDMWIMIVVDLLAISLLWVIWHAVGETIEDIDSKIEAIKFYGNLFLMLIVLLGPLLHVICTIEFLRPGTFDNYIFGKIGVNQLLLFSLIALIGFSFFLKYNFINYIENRGYVYCAEKSERSTFSKVYVFVRTVSDCNPD